MFRTRLPTIPLSAQGFAEYLTTPGQFFFAPCEFQIPSGEWMLLDFTLSDAIGGPGGLKRTEQLEEGGYKVELCAIDFTRDDQGRKVLGSLILPALQFILHEYDSTSTGAIVFLQEEALPCVLNVLRSIAFSFPGATDGIEQACIELQEMVEHTTTRSDQDNVSAVQKASPVTWNRSVIRQLLHDAFSDEELAPLCFDHFPAVYEEFGSGMSKGDKILRLLDYCVRREQVEDLLTAVQTANPVQYRRFEGQLRG